MYCTGCGSEMPEAFNYCSQCGTAKMGAVGNNRAHRAPRLSRPLDEKKIAGVCAGIARYLGVDVTLVRILTAIFAVYPPGLGLLFYVICWIVMPRDPLPAHLRPQGGEVANVTG
jgi:phage shock protein C